MMSAKLFSIFLNRRVPNPSKKAVTATIQNLEDRRLCSLRMHQLGRHEKRSYEAKISVLDVECRNPQARREAHPGGNCHKKAIAGSAGHVRTYTKPSLPPEMRKLMKKSTTATTTTAMGTINLGKYTLRITCSLLTS